MKINRYRKVNKTLKFYSNHFGFRKPYQVLLDGTVCVTALKNKINIYEQFKKYLGGDVKLLTTPCIVKEVEKLGFKTSNALYVLKNFGHHKCGHDEFSVSAPKCVLHMIQKENSSRYIIATQDRKLQQECRKIVGIPLLYFHLKMPTLEAPSLITQNAIRNKALHNFQAKAVGQEEFVKPNNENLQEKVLKTRKRIKGPNPLSCKKKKKKDESNNSENSNAKLNKRKRKRNRNKLVKNIKNEIFSKKL